MQDELQKYELHHRARIAIKPGITGMWQVSGRSDITDFEEVVRLDTEYISKWYGVTLSAENKKQFLIPEGFAHGFLVVLARLQVISIKKYINWAARYS